MDKKKELPKTSTGKVDKRSKAYRDSLKKLPKVQVFKKHEDVVAVYKSGLDTIPAKPSQQSYEVGKSHLEVPALTQSHQEAIHELKQSRDEHSTIINELLTRIEKLENKVG